MEETEYRRKRYAHGVEECVERAVSLRNFNEEQPHHQQRNHVRFDFVIPHVYVMKVPLLSPFALYVVFVSSLEVWFEDGTPLCCFTFIDVRSCQFPDIFLSLFLSLFSIWIRPSYHA